MAYVSSLAWLTLLLVSTIAVSWQAVHGFPFFESGDYALFPNWPEYRRGQIFALLGVTAAVLLLPKLLGTVLALLDPASRRRFGGTVTILRGVMAEQLFSTLLAPTMMMFHSAFVIATLCGRQVGWSSHARGDRPVTLHEAMRRQWWHLAFGAAWGGALLLLAPAFVLWLLPVLVGLLYAGPLTAFTSRIRDAGASRLFVTPEESAAPRELAILASAR
jgi:membrane glycosyltransferase